MQTPSTLRDREMAGLLDRLACGELEEASRRELIAWLEKDPLRWRLCGLAFLEAQSWSQTLMERKDVPPQSAKYSVLSTQYRASSRRWALAATLAAGVLLSFSLGFSLGGSFSPPIVKKSPGPSSEPTMATLAVHSSEDTTSQVQIPVVPGPLAAEASMAVPDYVRHKWERAGYQLSVERRYLFAKLSDGQQVVVPVEQIVVNQVSPQVY